MKTLHFGETTVSRCVESEGPSFFRFIFPDCDPDAFEAERRDWLDPHFVDAASPTSDEPAQLYYQDAPAYDPRRYLRRQS